MDASDDLGTLVLVDDVVVVLGGGVEMGSGWVLAWAEFEGEWVTSIVDACIDGGGLLNWVNLLAPVPVPALGIILIVIW